MKVILAVGVRSMFDEARRAGILEGIMMGVACFS